MVFHSDGFEGVWAKDALAALKKAFIPRGFKDALGVIDYAIVRERRSVSSPVAAFLGEPVRVTAPTTEGSPA